VRRERLSRDDLARLDSPRPPRRVHRDPPDIPVHYGDPETPAPCGLPGGSWAARTNRPEYVTCPACRPRQWLPTSAVEGWPDGIIGLVSGGRLGALIRVE
jgi:hypothetical protein